MLAPTKLQHCFFVTSGHNITKYVYTVCIHIVLHLEVTG